ncbi:hypothetical protein BUALT_Bualt09G0131400 [Buddleja alternifolia]|uniref:DCD domain-containing protein n=1 Tax=Buddleja alternifolia TaxID=168488 RepID=A0AAV6X8V5_9LAMI|nr:hypothetical protein BUALT_Bualt09G0131400 [Buddleja alternifolia]
MMVITGKGRKVKAEHGQPHFTVAMSFTPINMGGGRKTQTFTQSESFPSPWMAPNVPWARNLKKNQLGGVVFGCTNSTFKECLSKQLFGLPAQHFSYVQNIEPGLPLFLFNYSERKLHGIYEAASSGKMNFDSYAWTGGGLDRTKYPAQVQIHVRLKCQALTEHQFKPVIIDNYYSQTHFWFELDHAQANKLMSKLSSLAVSSGSSMPQITQKWTPVVPKFTSQNKGGESGASELPSLSDDFANSFDSIGTSTTSDDPLCLDGNNQLRESSLCNQMVQPDEKDLIYMKLKELALGYEFPDTNMNNRGRMVESAFTDDVDFLRETHDNVMETLGKRNDEGSFDSLDYPAIIAQLCGEVEELKAFKQAQTQKMETLERKLAEAEQEIYHLENRCMMLESISNPSMTLVGDESLIESGDESHLNLDDSILIVGGYDGVTWLSALHSFSPSHDVLRSLEPMSCARSYTSVARLGGELYVFGGGQNSTWYDTVESYNALNNQWTMWPSLNEKKGSLAVAALDGKFFTVGGGNGVECFSSVEMFDPNVGRWISGRSMLQKRFALAAVELNGALYAVGGYDGKEYLKSAERFDPREHSWNKIGSMDTKRGCHSLVKMNEKLYALGGYDGITMVPSVEIYDPRLGKWMSGEPMNQGRGFFAAAVLNNSVYVMGGVKSDEDSLDIIERYKDGEGWEATKLRAVGQRCFASAIVLGGD